MFLERTISQLDVGFLPPNQAEELAHLGYLQWLGSLRGDAGYAQEAMRAYDMARPFIQNSPAVAIFCHLLVTSATAPIEPLDLKLPPRTRRGGAKARRNVY